MRDQIEAQLWADHGAQFSADIAKALKWIFGTFARVTAIQHRESWRAPWRESGGEA